MASVSSLDKDLRSLRLDKYTPQRARETREWIEDTLGEKLQSGDLIEALKDGTALCKLVNLTLGYNATRFKPSSMPFVQMENISHFLRACQQPPLSLPDHDVFLTVDLYENKDPMQVLQCIGAFSRAAQSTNPSKIRRTLGARSSKAVSPQRTGDRGHGLHDSTRPPGTSLTSHSSSPADRPRAISPTSSATSWSKQADATVNAPAWNYTQYGWTGGASQGNQGISFGSRRQITTLAPVVPSLAERERKRREQEAEAERQRLEAEEAERMRRVELEAEEERAREAERRRWEEETKRLREKERREAEEEKMRWREQEQRWKEEEDARLKEEKEADARIEKERQQRRQAGDGRLKGQFLSQYQSEQRTLPKPGQPPNNNPESDRIMELERQLEEAREREMQYELERAQRMRSEPVQPLEPLKPKREIEVAEEASEKRSLAASERHFLRQEWSDQHSNEPEVSQLSTLPRPLPTPRAAPQTDHLPSLPSKISYNPQTQRPAPLLPSKSSNSNITTEQPLVPPTSSLPHPLPSERQAPSFSSRPLPNPVDYRTSAAHGPHPAAPSRTERFLSSHPAPQPAKPNSYIPNEALGSTSAEQEVETSRRLAAQQKAKAGGWASKSLLEREMERERQRQREWEESQKETKAVAATGVKDGGTNPGESWDVNQYGYIGGDNMNKIGGVYSGRRQIIGPRPLGGNKSS